MLWTILISLFLFFIVLPLVCELWLSLPEDPKPSGPPFSWKGLPLLFLVVPCIVAGAYLVTYGGVYALAQTFIVVGTWCEAHGVPLVLPPAILLAVAGALACRRWERSQ